MQTLNCKGKILSLATPVVMGIVNATHDSFFTGQLTDGLDKNLELIKNMLREGAAIIDIGGQSTRPGSERITSAEELERVIPLIKATAEKFPGIIISTDTYYAEVAAAAVQAGASIVNDISAGSMDDNMLATVAALRVPYVCMHMKGVPETMQENPQYEDVSKEVLDFFIHKTEQCRILGIHDVIIDPGFGFGKTATHNFQLLQQLQLLQMTGKPILAGLSRKGTITRTLGITAGEALNGTTVLNTIALLNGASILRVHDVKAANEAVKLVQAYKKSCP